MNHHAFAFDLRTASEAVTDEIAGIALGALFTFVLLWGMARVENVGEPHIAADIQDLRTYTVPFEPPPPLPPLDAPAEHVETVVPLSGIELGASESPVSIGVVPPDMELLFPASASAPQARVQFSAPQTDLRPKADIDIETNRIFQQSEVDQRPRAVVRKAPPIPPEVSGDAATMRVLLLLLIDQKGRVESVRVVESSGNERFDAIVARTVKDEWLFAPGVRRGKKVRVLAQQAFRVNFSGGRSPFTID